MIPSNPDIGADGELSAADLEDSGVVGREVPLADRGAVESIWTLVLRPLVAVDEDPEAVVVERQGRATRQRGSLDLGKRLAASFVRSRVVQASESCPPTAGGSVCVRLYDRREDGLVVVSVDPAAP